MITDIYLDVETTGTNPYRNGTWQIAAIIYEENQEVKTFNETCNIFKSQESHPKALEMADLTEEKLASFALPQLVYKQFIAFMAPYVDRYNPQDKMFLHGYNVRFDEDFMRQFFYNNNDKYFGSWFWFPPIDVMNLAMDKLKFRRPELKNFKQGTVAEELGLEVDKTKLHDALYDIRLCRRIHEELRKL